MQRFKELFPALVEFLNEQGESFPELEDRVWLRDFAYLVDIIEKLNVFNLLLQGKDKNIGGTISDVVSSTKKLELWGENLVQGEYKHFAYLKQILDKQGPSKFPYNNKEHIAGLSDLENQFNQRFQDFKIFRL